MTTSNPNHNLAPTWEVDHVGLAVKDLDAAIKLYSGSAHTDVLLRERLPENGVELVFLNTSGSKIELLAPLDNSSKVARFMEKRGPGLHHICYRVKDIVAELARLKATGASLIDQSPRHGAGGTKIAFIAPQSFMGVLTELCEYP
jgi:methylmalonyl-CoA/ethylmalonyl-CoA epimerase